MVHFVVMVPFLRRYCSCLLVIAGVCLTWQPQASAQSASTEPPAVEQSKPAEKPPVPLGKGQPGPETVDDRNRILTDLYARLSKADDPDYAKLVESAIQKMWSFSGSDTIDLLMSRVQVAVGSDNGKLAMRLLNAVVGLEPNYAEGLNRRAFIHFSNKDYGAALRDLRRVLTIDPKHYKAIGGLAVILREYGQDEAALKAFRKALEVHPFDPETTKAVKELEVIVEGQRI